MSGMSEPGIDVKKARENVAQGEVALGAALEIAKEIEGLAPDQEMMSVAVANAMAMAQVATARLAAAMAIANILLTDPAEAPDPLEH